MTTTVTIALGIGIQSVDFIPFRREVTGSVLMLGSKRKRVTLTAGAGSLVITDSEADEAAAWRVVEYSSISFPAVGQVRRAVVIPTGVSTAYDDLPDVDQESLDPVLVLSDAEVAALREYAAVNPSADALLLLAAANYAAMRTQLGLVIGTNVQAWSANLDEYAGINPTVLAGMLLVSANEAAMQAVLDLVPGVDVQAYSAKLAAYAAGASPTAAFLSIVDDATVAAILTTLSGGSAHLVEIAAITGAVNFDMMQRRSGAWTSRSLANIVTDLVTAGAVDLSTAQTLTEKRIAPRSSATASGSITPALSTDSRWKRTAQAATLVINAPTGSPTEGEKLEFRLKDDGTSRTLTWNAIFRSMVGTLPAATTVSKWHGIDVEYNATDTKWDTVAVWVQP